MKTTTTNNTTTDLAADEKLSISKRLWLVVYILVAATGGLAIGATLANTIVNL